MRFELYSDIVAFHNDVYELLLKNEVKNMVFLGNLLVGLSKSDPTGWRDPRGWVMASVKCEERVVLAALMIPDDKLQVCSDESLESGVLHEFVNGLKNAGIIVKGISAEYVLAEAFANIHSAAHNTTHEITKKGRIYCLEQINKEIITTSKIRLAKKKDLAFLPFWWNGFFECFDSLYGIDINEYERLVSTETLYILENDGIPVTMARIDQKLEQICGLGMVYTPPYFRNRGYATTITASLTELCLDEGYLSALITDLSNLVSNSIYQKIGYRPVCDILEIAFYNHST